IIVTRIPEIEFGGTNAICEGGEINLSITSTSPTPGTWTIDSEWQDNDQNMTPPFNASIINTASGYQIHGAVHDSIVVKYTTSPENGGCYNTKTIPIYPLPTITITPPITTICEGGEIVLHPRSDQESSFQWRGGDQGCSGTAWAADTTCADWTVEPLATTTYTIDVTTPHNILAEDGVTEITLNCVSNASKVVTVLPKPTGLSVDGIPATPICPGTSVTLTPSATGSGTGTLYYSWDGTTYVEAGDAGFTLTVTPDVTTSYTLYVKEVRTVGGVEYDCDPAQLPVTINVYVPPVLNVTGFTNLDCNGVNDGTISVSASSGNPFGQGTAAEPYYYEFSLDNSHFGHPDNHTQWTIEGLSGGNYTVYVRDQHCSDSKPVTLTQPAEPLTAWIHYPIVETCEGQSVGEASVEVSGGTPFGTAPSTYYEYEWNTSPVQTTATATGLAELTYRVVVTDSKGCTAITTVEITARDVPQYTLGGNNLTKCLSDPATELSVNLEATNPVDVESYSWTTASGAHAGMPATTSGAALNAITVTPDEVGDYTYTVVVAAENGCSVTSDYSLTISPIPTIALATGSGAKDQTKCYNEFQSGFTPIIFTYGGGATGVNFTWTSTPAPTCLSYNAGTMTISAVSAAPTAGATYTYRIETTTATGNACAQAAIEGTITIRPELTVSVTANHTACENDDIGVATALGQGGNPGTGSNPPYTYAWNNSRTTATIDELAAGTYSVTVTDDAGCSATNSVVIEEKTNPTISISKQNVNCYGETTGSIEVTVTNHGTTAGTSNPYTDGPTAQPNYYVFSKDNGTTTYNSSGAHYEQYPFTDLSTNGNETSYTYNIYVRDGNGCTVRENVEITQPTLLTATIDPDDIVKTCTDQSVGAATVTPAGGTQGTSPDPAYTYAWNTYPTASWGTNRTTQTISDLPEGSYRVTVTDAHGCEATATVAIEARPVPNFTLSVDGDDSKCYYDRETEIVVSNGGTGSNYAWSASATEAGLPAGSDGATVTVTPTAANTYTYNVTITAANACVVTASVPLTIYPVPTVEAPSSGIVEATCYGYDDGSFTLVATGGTIFSDGPTATPYYYHFSIDGGTEENFYSNVNSQVQNTIDGQTAGTYNVVVTDLNGCTASVTGGVEVWQPDAVTATIDPDNDIIETCDGQSVGEATVTPGGGRPGTAPAPAYTYAWNTYPTATWDPARTTQAISDLPEGSYSVTVTDGYGCIGSTTVAIGARQVPSINATSTLNDVCLSASTSTLSVLNNNTLSIASHSWSVTPTDGAGMPADNTTASLTVTPTASATAAVTYTYTDVVTAENGCVVSGDVVLTVNPTAILDHTSGDLDQTLCFEKTLVPIVFEYSGGATNITLTWTDETPANTCLNYDIDNNTHTLTISEGSTPVAGTYAYTVATTGAISPCDNPTLSGTIIIRPELTVSVTGDHQSCVTGNIGVATAHPVGGKPFGTAPDTYYNYLWSNTETTATIDELEGGITYRVTVTDANSCTAINSVAIVKNTNPEIEIADVETVCPAAGSITVSAEITTETSPDYIYRWTNDGSFAVTTTNPLTT
ncbi:MAG: hypothetical protein IIT61_08775, partial [Bacteroidales bacterium]|nr:hypothetical protein [Bacteroidales bacterium]